jgi:predicted permease
MREERVITWLESLLQDARYGSRSLRRVGLSTSVVILMLTLGIGANAAIFTLLNAVWLRPLPYEDAGRLVTLLDGYTKLAVGEDAPTVPEFLDVRRWTQSLEYMAFLDHRDFQVTGGQEPERVFGGRVTASFFPLLGVQPALGRVFRDDDNREGNENVVILADRLWRRAFAGDPAVVGRQLMVDGRPFTVVGVLPASFSFDHPGLGITEPVEIYVPFLMNDYYTLRSGSHSNIRRVRALARLARGYDVDSATAEMQVFAGRLATEHPDVYRSRPSGADMGFTMHVRSLQDAIVGGSRTMLWLLFAAVGIVLLIACANAAQFLLARGLERQDEVAVRLALGASRRRLVQQFLAESVILAAVSGALGFWCSTLIVRAFVALVPFRSPLLDRSSADGRVLAFTLGLSLLTAILFGLLPAISGSRSGARRSLVPVHGGRSRPRHALIAFEVALSMVLLASAAVLLRGMFQVTNAPRGYSPNDVTLMRLRLIQPRPELRSNASLQYQEYLSRISAIPGVEAAAILSGQPVLLTETNFVIDGYAGNDVATLARQTARYIVSPDYFRTLRIPLLEGRAFTESDTRDRPAVVIVNQELARRLWPHESALGKRLRLPRESTIVGVVGDTRMWGTALDMKPQLYVPSLQNWEPNAAIAVRTTAGAPPPIQAMKQAIWSIAPEQAVFNIRSMSQIVSGSVAQPRFTTLLLGSFAVLALVLSTAGLYGFVSYLVSRRAREIAIRMAIGAQRSHVFWLVSGQTILWTLGGLAIGAIGAIAASLVLASTVEGVARMDLTTLAGAGVMYLMISTAATYGPARRAFRLDTMRAIRCD